MNVYYPVERFFKIIENASGEDALFSNKGGVCLQPFIQEEPLKHLECLKKPF